MKFNLSSILVIVIIIAIVGYVVNDSAPNKSSSSLGSDSQISLTTDPDPLKLGNATFMISVKEYCKVSIRSLGCCWKPKCVSLGKSDEK